MKNILLFTCLLSMPALAQTITGGSCAPSNLNGTYSLILSGRGISSAGSFAGSFQGVGLATFDGLSKVTFTGTYNTNSVSGQTFTYSGTYTLWSNCLGTVTLTQGSTATFTLVVWSSGVQYNIAGSDANYIYSGSGSSNQPACATPTLSGAYTYDASGFLLSGTAQTGAADESGLFQFDGQGNVTAAYTITSGGTTPAQVTSTGTYTVSSNCVATASLKDSNGQTNALNIVINGAYGQNLNLIEANPQFVRSGTAHSAFSNPTQSIANVASYAVNAVPPGSVLVLFGFNLATKADSPTTIPLPDSLLTTSVTVNEEPAPLFYVSPNQIDAQMPWDIPGNTVASVIVKNGSSTSNAAAVYVPATGTPGLSFFGSNRAVIVNKDNATVNTATTPAAVGDEVTAYFTGGGPVTASGKLATGAASPGGLSPVSGQNSVTVGGMSANVVYMGLTPGSIGLYQANFIVPQLAKGSYPVVITIAGQASNALGGPNPNPVMNVSN